MNKIIFWSYGSICEPYLEECFKKIAEIYVIRTDNQDMEHQSLKDIEKLRNAIIQYRPMFVFSVNFFREVSNVCQEENVKYVGYTVDVPVNSLFCKELKNSQNHIFMFDRSQYEQFRNVNPEGIYYLPLAASVPSLQKAIVTASNSLKQVCKSDVTFVGSLYEEKDELVKFLPYLSENVRGYLDGLMDIQLRIPTGYIVKECLPDNLVREFQSLCPMLVSELNNEKYVISHYLIGMHLAAMERLDLLGSIADKYVLNIYTQSNTDKLHRAVNCGVADSYSVMPVIFAMSKINLNITFRSIETGLPQRIWDVCGCGGFLLTNYQEELTDYFEIGTDVECYFSKEELLDKIDYYLKHDALREKIARNGYEKVAKYHTYENRVQEILRKIKE